MKELTFIIVDDHSLVRIGLKKILEADERIHVVAEAENSEIAIWKIAKHGPDFVTIDISLEEKLTGLTLIKTIASRFPSVKIITLSMHESAVFAERAIRSGAHAYLTKKNADRLIHDVIEKVLEGEIYIEREVSSQMMKSLHLSSAKKSDISALLSDRELEYFTLLGSGYTLSEITEKMHVSSYSVESYRRRIKKKLNIKTAAALHTKSSQWVLENKMDSSSLL